jgi:hypothetical protein
MQPLIELWTFATAWYNLPFTLALLAFLTLSALQFIGLGEDQDTDHDLDLDVDHDLDLEHEADLDHDLVHAAGHPVEAMAVAPGPKPCNFWGWATCR